MYVTQTCPRCNGASKIYTGSGSSLYGTNTVQCPNASCVNGQIRTWQPDPAVAPSASKGGGRVRARQNSKYTFTDFLLTIIFFCTLALSFWLVSRFAPNLNNWQQILGTLAPAVIGGFLWSYLLRGPWKQAVEVLRKITMWTLAAAGALTFIYILILLAAPYFNKV